MMASSRFPAAPRQEKGGCVRVAFDDSLGRRVTARDVAAASGVSTSVVSLVLNDRWAGRVGPETRERVQAVAERLGYRIDGRGRSLATGRTGIIGYVAPEVNPFFTAVQRFLLSELNPDFQLITLATEMRSPEGQRNLRQLLALAPDALVVSTIEPDQIDRLRPACPVLILDSPGKDSRYPRINLDVRSSAADMAGHLVELGHRRIVYIDLAAGSRTIDERRSAFFDAFRSGAADGEVVEVIATAVEPDPTRAVVREAWRRWHQAGVTALVCGSDPQAFGAIAALHDLAVDVPGAVSVTGGDDQPFSTIVQPSLTTVRLPVVEMGALSAAAVRQLLTDPRQVEPLVTLGTELVVRESTAAAAAPARRHVKQRRQAAQTRAPSARIVDRMRGDGGS